MGLFQRFFLPTFPTFSAFANATVVGYLTLFVFSVFLFYPSAPSVDVEVTSKSSEVAWRIARGGAALCCAWACAAGFVLAPVQPLAAARAPMAQGVHELTIALEPLREDAVLYRQQRQLLGPLAHRLRFAVLADGEAKVDTALMAALRARVINHQDAYFACPPFSAAAEAAADAAAADASASPSDVAEILKSQFLGLILRIN